MPSLTISARVAGAVVNLESALNLPALSIALILRAILKLGTNAGLWLALPFIPVLWYIVGLWLDRRLGWARRSAATPSRIRRVSLAISFCAAVLFGIPLLQTIYEARRTGGTLGNAWLDLGVCTWYAFLLVVLAEMIRSSLFSRPDDPRGYSEPA